MLVKLKVTREIKIKELTIKEIFTYINLHTITCARK